MMGEGVGEGAEEGVEEGPSVGLLKEKGEREGVNKVVIRVLRCVKGVYFMWVSIQGTRVWLNRIDVPAHFHPM